MAIKVVRGDADCPLCQALWDLLDYSFTERPASVTAEDAEHFLASVCVWWVAQSLAQCDGRVAPLLRCLSNALREHGYDVTAIPDSRPGARPS
jgi:hypothetical protein